MAGNGVVYGVGVGSGDPELITLKAARIMREVPVIAVPGAVAEEALAYRIALAAVPEIRHKHVVALTTPMVRDHARVLAAHRANARVLEQFLDEDKDVAFLTLGDPSIYSTFGYLRAALEHDGYATRQVAGVPSFCAAAARCDMTLVEGDEPLLIGGAGNVEERLSMPGTQVFLKAGARMSELKAALMRQEGEVRAVERCGMEGERVFVRAHELPHDASYLTLVIAKRVPQSSHDA